MPSPGFSDTPERDSYDVVIVGAAMMGASVAWWLSRRPDFDGRILVVERDPSFATASTSLSNSCIRQQFSTAINVALSRFGVEFIRGFRDWIGDPEAPEIAFDTFGYLYLAAGEAMADALRQAHEVQQRAGAATRLMTPEDLAAAFPFIEFSDIVLGSYGPRDEGYFEGQTICDWWRRMARRAGVEFVADTVTGIEHEGGRVVSVRLRTAGRIAAGQVVNAAGPEAARVAGMAGLELPVEPRRRFTFVFDAAEALPGPLPLTVDPSGVHMRSDGAAFMAGCAPDEDVAAWDDFSMDHELWENRVWPALAARVPAFARLKLRSWWVGHYAYNTIDRNAVIGPHPELRNFLFCNGFSGHGLQHAPAVGRGLAEWIATGGWQSLDLSPLGFERLADGVGLREAAVI